MLMKQKLDKMYERLAASLGDVEFRLFLLKQEKSNIISQIEQLNKLAGLPTQEVPNEASQVLVEKA